MTDAPPRIDWLDDALPADGLPGRLGVTILPGKHRASIRYPGRVYHGDLATDLAALVASGVGRLILLVDDTELQRWGDVDIVQRAASVGVEVLRHPMPDGGTPRSLAEMDRILAEVRAGRAVADVAIACMGGVGRSGVVAACALVEAGMSADAAIAHLRTVRHPDAVETAEQGAFVIAYAGHIEP